MKLTFLGTGGGRINLIKQIRATGGICISGPKNIHIDPGPGALVRMRNKGMDPLKTDIMVVTHSHIDHIGDAGVLIEGMSHYALKKKGTLIASEDALGGEIKGQKISGFHLSRLETVVRAKPGETFEFEGGKISFKKAVHDDFPAFGFVLEMGGKKIGYTGDTEYFEEMPEEYAGCDLLIINVMKPFADEYKGHLTAEDASKLIGRVQPKLAILTHMGLKMLRYPAEKRASEVEAETGVRVIAAEDGMEIGESEF
ncbi:MBL fold metallo-hydrolase [Candidatus Micrarchaeota archaeon]|nr:MBL fold metallo-hydrolase [Candidatus Micrarchaeota archaeon]